MTKVITPVSLLIIAILSVSCTKDIPKLDSSKPLHYSFKQPQRKVLSGKQAGLLGRPDMKSVAKKSNTYYSANGNICRHLSNNKTACYIGGKWYESVGIVARGR